MENNVWELIDHIGPIFGYITAAIALFALVKTGFLQTTDKHIKAVVGKDKNDKVHREMDERIDALEEKFAEFLERDEVFKNEVRTHNQTQKDVDRKLMANIIETTYYTNREKRSLDMFEFRRITEVYAIYHSDDIHGNSYITELYEEMLEWERV